MVPPESPLAALRRRFRDGTETPLAALETSFAHANSNTGHNVYLAREEAWSRSEAASLNPADLEAQPLWGTPISLKDCFDLAGFPTSCGSSFYRDHNGIAAEDSSVAARLRAAGAIITGKTHLHQLAYGITGENSDFGDCLQPYDSTQLTGGSSSGAAASVQEGSALAAIGTDTGGSIRVPAALCGLSGFRASIALGAGLWRGGAHLAPSFDTLGWLYRDLRDGPTLAHALFDLPPAQPPQLSSLRIGIPHDAFLHDAEPAVLDALHHWQSRLEDHHVSFGIFDAGFWNDALSIFNPIQASEAATLHAGRFHHFEPAIAERLTRGASISPQELQAFQAQRSLFCDRTAQLFDRFDYLLLPCSPMIALLAGADHALTRPRILRYTAPMSLAGLPVVTLPGLTPGDTPGGPSLNPGGPSSATVLSAPKVGWRNCGLQLVASSGADAALLALSASLAHFVAA